MRVLALAAIAAFSIGCGSAGGGTASGLKGLVKRGPVTPVCRVGQPCDAPAKGVKLLFSRAGKVAATATTNGKGWYRVTLRPGRYSVRTNLRRFGTRPQPASVTVPSGRVARRDFFVDTGIR